MNAVPIHPRRIDWCLEMASSERDLVRAALSGDATAMRGLVDHLTPVIQARVARAILRGRSTTHPRSQLEDLTQEIFLSLFSSNAQILRAWNPERGFSLQNFVGLVAEREVISIMRSGRKSGWAEDPTLLEDLDSALEATVPIDHAFASREVLAFIVERLHTQLTPRGLELFYRLIVDEESVEDVARLTGMTTDALYAWRSRLSKLVRALALEAYDSGAHKRASDAGASPRTPNKDRHGR